MRLKPISGRHGGFSVTMMIFAVCAILATSAIIYGVAKMSGGGVQLSGVSTGNQMNDPTNTPVKLDTTAGTAATVTNTFLDIENNNPATQITGVTGWAYNDAGGLLATGGSLASLTTTVGRSINFQTNSTNQYCDTEANGYAVDKTALPLTINCHTIAAEASMVSTLYDTTNNNNAVNANINTSVADYNLSLAANEKRALKFDLRNNDDQSLWRLGAICTTYGSNSSGITDFQVKDTKWTEVTIPKELRNQQLTMSYGSEGYTAGTVTISGFKHCYVPASTSDNKPYVDLKQYQSLGEVYGMPTIEVEAGTSNPFVNAQAYGCVLAVDYGYNTNINTKMTGDFYRHDINERVTEIGRLETIASPIGRQSGACVELT